MNGKIVNNDVRIQSHAVQTYRGHTLEVCRLKWSNSGRQLASGGNDNLLHIWDISMSSSNAPRTQNQYVHRFGDHNATVKALAWCPFENNLLASGGGENDKCIKFYNTNIGSCLNSIDTGSQVCSLLWNTNEHELLSSHGFTQNQLTLWKYPSMTKIAELTGHTSRVLFMAQSPDGSMVASAAADETLRFWNVFRTPQVAKRGPKATTGPFSNVNLIRGIGHLFHCLVISVWLSGSSDMQIDCIVKFWFQFPNGCLSCIRSVAGEALVCVITCDSVTTIRNAINKASLWCSHDSTIRSSHEQFSNHVL